MATVSLLAWPLLSHSHTDFPVGKDKFLTQNEHHLAKMARECKSHEVEVQVCPEVLSHRRSQARGISSPTFLFYRWGSKPRWGKGLAWGYTANKCRIWQNGTILGL